MDIDLNVYSYDGNTTYTDEDGVEYTHLEPWDGKLYHLGDKGAYYMKDNNTTSYYLHEGHMYENKDEDDKDYLWNDEDY